jgi:tRNA(Ile)-lysidine synthase
MASRLAAQVRKTLVTFGVTHDERLVVGVSGGADSVALLCLLCEWSASRVVAVYIDHQLRDGTEAEARFVESLCQRLGAMFESAKIDTKRLQGERRSGVEEAARVGRYEALRGAAHKHSARWIATGHTADDQAETVLWRFLRGGTIESLSGMDGVTSLNSKESLIVRPLLNIRRSELRQYLEKRQQTFIEDPTNSSKEFTRNRLRAEVMPLLQQENPAVVEGLCQLAREARQVEELLQTEARVALERVKIRQTEGEVALSIKAMKKETRLLQERVLRLVLPTYSLSRGHAEAMLQMMSAEGGKRIQLGEMGVSRHRDELIIHWAKDRTHGAE